MTGRALRALVGAAAVIIFAAAVVLFVRPVLRGAALVAVDIALVLAFLVLVYFVIFRALGRRSRSAGAPPALTPLREAPIEIEEPVPSDAEVMPEPAKELPAAKPDRAAEIEAELRELKKKLGGK